MPASLRPFASLIGAQLWTPEEGSWAGVSCIECSRGSAPCKILNCVCGRLSAAAFINLATGPSSGVTVSLWPHSSRIGPLTRSKMASGRGPGGPEITDTNASKAPSASALDKSSLYSSLSPRHPEDINIALTSTRLDTLTAYLNLDADCRYLRRTDAVSWQYLG